MSQNSQHQRNKHLQDLYKQGKTISEISKSTGWSKETVRLAVKDLPCYSPRKSNKNQQTKPTQQKHQNAQLSQNVGNNDSLSFLHQVFNLASSEDGIEQVEKIEKIEQTCKSTTSVQNADRVETTPTDEQNIKWVANNNMVNLVVNGTVYAADNTNPHFAKIIEACLAEDFEQARKLLRIGKGIEEFSDGFFLYRDGKLFFADEELHGVLVQKIVKGFSEGLDMKRYIRFIELSMENQQNSVDEMWNFLKHNDIEINENGLIVGYKKVSDHDGVLKDSHTGTVVNKLGTVVKMPRTLVNNNKNETCSHGLHVGSMKYVKEFYGDTVIRVLVNPADVVSVPTDYNGMKMRCSEYFVEAVVDYDFSENEVQNSVTGVSIVGKNGLIEYTDLMEIDYQ